MLVVEKRYNMYIYIYILKTRCFYELPKRDTV